jgi:single-stranded DNA-binding protein
VNGVSLIGQLAADPELRINGAGEDECRMRIAVPRRTRAGGAEPGVVYVEVTAVGRRARDCAESLSAGSRVGLLGWLHTHDSREMLRAVATDQLYFL